MNNTSCFGPGAVSNSQDGNILPAIQRDFAVTNFSQMLNSEPGRQFRICLISPWLSSLGAPGLQLRNILSMRSACCRALSSSSTRERSWIALKTQDNVVPGTMRIQVFKRQLD